MIFQLRYGSDVQKSLDALKHINIGFNQDRAITLAMVADFSIVQQLSQINRSYRQTALDIGANLEDDATIEEAKERRHYIKPSERKRKAKKRSDARRRKELAKQRKQTT